MRATARNQWLVLLVLLAGALAPRWLEGQASTKSEATFRQLRSLVGDWQVDLCAGTGDAAVGLVCAVHPDGPAAHIERQETLARAGWRLVDAYPSRWGGDAVRAALDLAPRLGPAAAPALSPSGEADGVELL